MLIRFIIITLIVYSASTFAERWEFDSSQLGLSKNSLDIFNNGGQLPGTYHVEVVLNGEVVDSRSILFIRPKGISETTSLVPCLDASLLSQYGIKMANYSLHSAPTSKDHCSTINEVPGMKAIFSFSNQQLLLTVPQVALRKTSKELAPEEQWNDGIAAVLLNYQASETHTSYHSYQYKRQDSPYVLLEPGLNFGAWRLRHSISWQKTTGKAGRWKRAYTFAEQGLYKIKSRLTLGKRFTPSEVFDSVPFKGVMIGSDDEMVPFSERRFSPDVQGYARALSKVIVRQQGYMLYDGTVPPGPFKIDNLSPISGGGDLDVTVEEIGGKTQHYIVSWQTPAIALHSGYFKYNVMVGKFSPENSDSKLDNILQASLMYGLPKGITAYSGIQKSTDFQALSLGAGVSIGNAGSISLDSTQTRFFPNNMKHTKGEQWRVRYSKSLGITNTSLGITYSWSPSFGYSTFPQALSTSHRSLELDSKIKKRTLINLNQPLGNYGYLSLSHRMSIFSQNKNNEHSDSIRYSTHIRNLTLSLDWTRSRWLNKKDRILAVMIGIPLQLPNGYELTSNEQMLTPSSGRSTLLTGLSGSAQEKKLNWSVMQRYQPNHIDTQPMYENIASLGWRGHQGLLSINANNSSIVTNMGASIAGSTVLTNEGGAYGQPLYGAASLIIAPGASNIPVGGWPGISTDARGYAILGGLQPYQQNLISLDPSRLSKDAEISRTDMTVIPTHGAIISAAFITHIGKKALIKIMDMSGKVIPFGSVVTTEDKKKTGSGIVDENGKVYLSGLADHGQLLIRWGLSPQDVCRSYYHLKKNPGPTGIYNAEVTCDSKIVE